MPLGFGDLGSIVTPFRLAAYQPDNSISTAYQGELQRQVERDRLKEAAQRRQMERDAERAAEAGRMSRAGMDSADRAAQERRLGQQFQTEQERKDQEDLDKLLREFTGSLGQQDPTSRRIYGELLRRHPKIGGVELPEETAPPAGVAPAENPPSQAAPPQAQQTGEGAAGWEPSEEEKQLYSPEELAEMKRQFDGGAPPPAAEETAEGEWDPEKRKLYGVPDFVPPGEEAAYFEMVGGGGLSEEDARANFQAWSSIGENAAPGQQSPEEARIAEEKRQQRRIELGQEAPPPAGLGSSSGPGGGKVVAPWGTGSYAEQNVQPAPGIRSPWAGSGQPQEAAPQQAPAPTGLGQQSPLSSTGQGLGGGQQPAPAALPNRKAIVRDKAGNVLFETSLDTIAKEQRGAVDAAFANLKDRAAAERARKGALAEVGLKPLPQIIDDWMKRYEYEVSQAGKDRRAVIGSPAGPSLAERRFAESLSSGEQDEAWKIVNNRIRQDSLPKYREALSTLSSIGALVGRGSGYADRTALKTQIVALEKRATDADMQIALNSGGFYDRIVAAKNYLLGDGELSPDIMAEVQGIAQEGKRRILTTLKAAGEDAYNMAMAHPTIGEERRKEFAGWVYGTITGDFSRMPKKPGAGGGQPAESDEARRKRLGF